MGAKQALALRYLLAMLSAQVQLGELLGVVVGGFRLVYRFVPFRNRCGMGLSMM